jgi:hypothetical protein
MRSIVDIRKLVLAGLMTAGCLFLTQAGADEVEKLLFLVVEKDEVIASNTMLGRFDRLEMSAKERIQEYKISNAVAVVVTNQRYIAYGVPPGSWKDRRIRAGEKLESLEVADYSATLVTSDRILNFYGRTGTWSDTKR